MVDEIQEFTPEQIELRWDAIQEAQVAIGNSHTIVYTVASLYGKQLCDVAHTMWFLHAVAAQFYPEGFSEYEVVEGGS